MIFELSSIDLNFSGTSQSRLCVCYSCHKLCPESGECSDPGLFIQWFAIEQPLEILMPKTIQ